MKTILVVMVCLWAGLASAQEPAPAVASRVVIVDSLNVELGPWFDGGVLMLLDGSHFRNWSPSDTTPHDSQWMVFYVYPGGFQTGGLTTYYTQTECGGQPYMLLSSWFARPVLDPVLKMFSVAGELETVTVRSKRSVFITQGPCLNTAPTATAVGKVLTFDPATVGVVPPFHAEVVPERTGTDSVAREMADSVRPARAR